MGTFVDPREESGRMNEVSHEDLVELITLNGKEWLFYKGFSSVDVAIIRGTTADETGNLSTEQESNLLQILTMAQAASNSGGLVFAQAKRAAANRTLDPRLVRVPGMLVDAVVIDEEQRQIEGRDKYNPAYCGEVKVPTSMAEPSCLDERTVVARRAAMELEAGAVVNLGVGMSDGIPDIAVQKGIINELTMTVEQGTTGGIPGRGLELSCQTNPQAIISESDQFIFYNGGGLDLAFLSFAQIDEEGNVNVSKFGQRVFGPGGFIDITQGAKKVVFCGSFAGSGCVRIEEGKIRVAKGAKYTKFKKKVEQISFSASFARRRGQQVLYVTERTVFGLEDNGIALRQIAPGVNLENDILSPMEFRPAISPDIGLMDREIFR